MTDSRAMFYDETSRRFEYDCLGCRIGYFSPVVANHRERYGMKLPLTVLSLMLIVFCSNILNAGPRDPWYVGYVVRGGSIIQYMGPYASEYRCLAMRYRMPRGTEFIGCFQ
jgi:hypothetical protein